MPDTTFVQQYLQLREREGRLYSDDVVRSLPWPSRSVAHAAEWRLRARSARRLRAYLAARRPQRLLEVGCGNGWLTNYLCRIPGVTGTGIDINGPELAQARRLFVDPALTFRETTLGELAEGDYDCIVFAASFQYFYDVPAVLGECFRRLRAGGAVHIIDTHFYKVGERSQARLRSARYFAGQGADAMESWYFHHGFEALAPYPYQLLNPLSDRLRRFTGTVFPWVKITGPA